ncbi:hypothetical protein HYW67_01090 [Candidatus Parcubacteria bacterium]|nr:hypothetical protein [Candidatus Parcubacteria bacterium]
MIKKIAIFTVFLAAVFTAAYAPHAEAAVPTAVVSFEANTAYEQSLEKFLLGPFSGFISSFTTSFFSTFFGALQQRNEDFQKTFELGKIEAAREDVNKLTFDTLRELKEGALGGVIVGNPNEARAVIKGMGFRTPPEIAESSARCASGARINGDCLVVKREGRIVTNVDHYLYEEPVQKARDYVNCYYNLLEWRQANDGFATYSILSSPDPNSPSPTHIRDSILQLDLQKISVLADLQRTERGLQNSPPVSWYRGGDVSQINWDRIKESGAERDKLLDVNKCDIILRNITCRDAVGCFNASRLSDLVTYDSENAPNDNLRFLERNYLQQGFDASFLNAPPADLLSPDFPTVKVNVGTSPTWDWRLIDQSRNPMNTLSGLREKVSATVQRLIAEAHENRKAQFVAGQGVRPETYLIGFPDTQAKAENLRGKYYFIDTENIISPSFILLAKVQAAIQAQFDLAQKAYKYPPEANIKTDKYPFVGFERNLSDGSPKPVQLEVPTLKPTIDKLPAPFEDFGQYLNLPSSLVDNPAAYAQNGPPNTQTKTPNTNYLNKFFKEVLQLHERSFGDVLALWFTDEASFFRPRSNVSQFFSSPAALSSVSSALETSVSRLDAAIAELERTEGVSNKAELLAASREARTRLEESRNHLRAENTATAQTIYGNVLEADLKVALVERGLAGTSTAAGFREARAGIGTGSPAFTQLERAATREQVNYALETANQARTILGSVPGGGAASAEVGRAVSMLQQTDNLVRQAGAINTADITRRTNESIAVLRNATGIIGQAGAPASGAYQALGRIQTGIYAIERAQNVLTDANRVGALIASGDPLTTLTGISQALNIFGSLQNLFSGFGLSGLFGL